MYTVHWDGFGHRHFWDEYTKTNPEDQSNWHMYKPRVVADDRLIGIWCKVEVNIPPWRIFRECKFYCRYTAMLRLHTLISQSNLWPLNVILGHNQSISNWMLESIIDRLWSGRSISHLHPSSVLEPLEHDMIRIYLAGSDVQELRGARCRDDAHTHQTRDTDVRRAIASYLVSICYPQLAGRREALATRSWAWRLDRNSRKWYTYVCSSLSLFIYPRSDDGHFGLQNSLLQDVPIWIVPPPRGESGPFNETFHPSPPLRCFEGGCFLAASEPAYFVSSSQRSYAPFS